MKWQGEFLQHPLPWIGCYSITGFPPPPPPPTIKFATHLSTWVDRGTVRVQSLAKEHSTMSLARDWIWSTPCGLKYHCTFHWEAVVNKKLPGHPMKFQFGFEQLSGEFPLPGNGPSLPPCMHFPKPVPEPSSHQPHPGSMWQSRHDFISEHCRPTN